MEQQINLAATLSGFLCRILPRCLSCFAANPPRFCSRRYRRASTARPSDPLPPAPPCRRFKRLPISRQRWPERRRTKQQRTTITHTQRAERTRQQTRALIAVVSVCASVLSYHIGLLKAKLAKLKREILAPSSKGGPAGVGFDVTKVNRKHQLGDAAHISVRRRPSAHTCSCLFCCVCAERRCTCGYDRLPIRWKIHTAHQTHRHTFRGCRLRVHDGQ